MLSTSPSHLLTFSAWPVTTDCHNLIIIKDQRSEEENNIWVLKSNFSSLEDKYFYLALTQWLLLTLFFKYFQIFHIHWKYVSPWFPFRRQSRVRELLRWSAGPGSAELSLPCKTAFVCWQKAGYFQFWHWRSRWQQLWVNRCCSSIEEQRKVK